MASWVVTVPTESDRRARTTAAAIPIGSAIGTFAYYLDDQDEGANAGDFTSGFTVPIRNQPFYFGGDTYQPFEGDIADVWIAPGVDLRESGDIPEATRRKFSTADNKPVDLGSDCSAPTGTVPAICFSGDASTFGTNKGNGGAFTLSGTLTNAATSPSN